MRVACIIASLVLKVDEPLNTFRTSAPMDTETASRRRWPGGAHFVVSAPGRRKP